MRTTTLRQVLVLVPVALGDLGPSETPARVVKGVLVSPIPQPQAVQLASKRDFPFFCLRRGKSTEDCVLHLGYRLSHGRIGQWAES